MKCMYTQCKLGGEVDKDIAVKSGRYYYHKECFKEKEQKKEIEKMYYDKFQNNEPIQAVRRAINKYVNKDNYEPEYILFVLNENIKLNSMFGLIYYLRNDNFSNKYNKEKAKQIKFDVDKVNIEESHTIQYKKKKRKGWGDIICQ